MLKTFVIGNLGADAELRRDGGAEFISMSIAHSRTVRDAAGRETKTTEWISATFNGAHEKLLPFLTKGTKVAVFGDVSLRLFHSERDRMQKAGLNLYIRDLELLSVNSDIVPRRLYDRDGVAFNTEKWYLVRDCVYGELHDASGHLFLVNPDGWVTPIQSAPASAGGAAVVPADNAGVASGNNEAGREAEANS